ncbi:hypothetical protein Zmor_020594 [Zophobas morio]|uniref:Coiled-coil domain-containing protein 112 n=1 Tax=Zophobas morio TaxID=2755281 RepID=A0AA38I660_9CUCU|nr:hypothetical protein Zmor_020594 [Zophobas morio]
MNTFLSDANKLKNIQYFLEKNDPVFNHVSKCGCDLSLVDYVLQLEQKRKNETEQITNELKNIWHLLHKKRNILLDKNVNNLDLHLFKQDMIEIQDKIHTLRVKLLPHYDVLKDEEKNITEMNELFRQKLEDWEKPVKSTSRHNYTISKQRAVDNTNLKEVLAFMEFVNNSNGHENGWPIEDHQLFLKLRHKYKNIDDLAINFNKLLPDIASDAVKQHEDWYQKYLFLKNRKNEALEKWRKQKNSMQEKQDINDENVLRATTNKTHTRVQKDNIYEQIMLWKAEKEAKRQQKEAYEQLQKDIKKRREENQKTINLHVKEVVAKWKEAKIVREQNEKVQREIQEYYGRKIRAATANRMIKQFQTQDDLFIAKMRSTKLKEENQNKKRSKSSYLVDRDPDRVLKPTRQWLFRTTKNDIFGEVSSHIPNIREIPKLKIPEWRKNI